jgi:hypothetical protein
MFVGRERAVSTPWRGARRACERCRPWWSGSCVRDPEG